MEYIEKIKKMLCKELDEYAMKGKLTMADLEAVHKLTDTVKNLDKIEMLEEDEGGYSEARGGMRGRYYMQGSSYDDDVMYSERRGRGRNARRDSMGRYSSDDGMSYDDYSEERMDRRYSRDAKDHMMSKLGEMMEEAENPKEREALHQCMMKLKNG